MIHFLFFFIFILNLILSIESLILMLTIKTDSKFVVKSEGTRWFYDNKLTFLV